MLEVLGPEVSVQALLAGVVLVLGVSAYVLMARPSSAMLMVACLSAVGVVALPNFGPPWYLKVMAPLICLPLTAAAYLREKARPQLWSRATWLIVILFAYEFGSAVIFDSTRVTQSIGLQLLSLFPLIALLPRFEAVQLQRFLLFVASLACAQAILAMLEALGITSPLWGLLGQPVPRWGNENSILPGDIPRGMGTMAHPIPLGMLCAFSAIFLLASNNIKWRVTVPMTLVLAGGILASGSRSALIVVLMGLAGGFITKGGRVDWAKMTIALLGICTLALGTSLAALIGAKDVSSTLSYVHRASALGVLPDAWSQPVPRLAFGASPETMGDLVSLNYLTTSGITAIDNQWVSLLLNNGIFGVLILISVLVSIWVAGSMAARIGVLAFVLSTWSFDIMAWNVGVMLLLIISQPSYGRVALNIATRDRFLIQRGVIFAATEIP